jgi:16S rRNA (cytidine1402-2'-O)-methyltransferase
LSRLGTALAALAEGLGDREAAVARELTKLYEECVTGPLMALADRYTAAPPKGEIVVVIAPPPDDVAEAGDDDAVDAALADALVTMPVAKAAKAVAARFGRERSDLYARSLALKAGA